MSEGERTVSHVLDNGFVRIGSVISIVAFLTVASYNVGAWFNSIETKLEVIEKQLIQGTSDRWRQTEMLRWCRETELKNPGWVCGELD